MHSWLRKIFGPRAYEVSEETQVWARKVSELLNEQHRALAQLRDDHEQLKLKFTSFQGRVYAWRRGENPAIAPESPQELPLTDPRVSKAELRARLLKPGKPFKHQN